MSESKPSPENRNYEEMAIRLGSFVNEYIPSGWKESLRSVMPSFFFLAEEAERMESDFAQGCLRENLEKRYRNPNVVDAIMTFFEKRVSE